MFLKGLKYIKGFQQILYRSISFFYNSIDTIGFEAFETFDFYLIDTLNILDISL